MPDFQCNRPGCGFVSVDHPTKTSAEARGKQHRAEHETGKPMPELADFVKKGS